MSGIPPSTYTLPTPPFKCPRCGKFLPEGAKFCPYCRKKVRKVCKCWVKKMPYDCGMDKCPGYKLWMIEKKKEGAKSMTVTMTVQEIQELARALTTNAKEANMSHQISVSIQQAEDNTPYIVFTQDGYREGATKRSYRYRYL